MTVQPLRQIPLDHNVKLFHFEIQYIYFEFNLLLADYRHRTVDGRRACWHI